jgi:hypothetical protein
MKFQPNPRNRWIIVMGAILIQLALGAIYAWSVYSQVYTHSQPVKLPGYSQQDSLHLRS